MEVAIAFNLKKKEEDKPPDYFSEYDKKSTVLAIASALRSKGHKVDLIEVNSKDLIEEFSKRKVDIIFNISEGNGTAYRESEVPAILDLLGIPYTGSSPFTLALTLDKAMTKRIFRGEGIPTPNFQVFKRPNTPLDPNLKFPLIVKPNREGSAKGINVSCVVREKKELYRKIEGIFKSYRQEVLVEEFIEGKELTVGILENGSISVLPILEIDFSTCREDIERFYSWRMKEYQGNKELGLTPTFFCPARIPKKIEEKIKLFSLKAHLALGCKGLSRIDLRLSRGNIPYFLEVNPLPGLDPEESNFPMMAKAAGIDYADLIEIILNSSLEKRCN